MSTDFITLTEYKTYAGITNPNQDAQIKAIIPMACQLARTLCRRSFTDYIDDPKVEVFTGGGPKLYMSEYPLINLVSVEYSMDGGKTYTAMVEYSDFVINNEDMSVQTLYTTEFPARVNGYKVTYTAGYETIPSDLKVAVMDLVTYYLKSDMSVKSQRSVNSNNLQIEYITTDALPPHISRVFNMYISAVN
jgi:hypothetical protein